MRKINRKAFYDSVRRNLFGGRLNVHQVRNMELILNEAERRQMLSTQLAYIFATVLHETAKTMQPIREYGRGRGYAYGKKLKMGDGPGKRIPYTSPDHLYYGRGHVQVTWFENYEELTRRNNKGWDFLNNPDLLLEEEPSIWAAFTGMLSGMFTGKRLDRYITVGKTNYLGARYVINGKDKRELIQKYAILFEKAITYI